MIAMVIVNAVSLFIIDMLFDGISFSNTQALVTTGFILGLVNALVVPLMKLIFFPFTVLTLGLFSLVINGFALYATLNFVEGAYVADLFTAILAAIVLGIVNGFVNSVFD